MLFLLLTVGLGFGIYYLFDVVFNGSVLNWLADNFFYTETQYNYITNEFSYLYRPNWSKLKGLLLTLFLGMLIIYVLSLYLAAHFHGKSMVRKSISKTSGMLYTYMHHDLDSADVFPLLMQRLPLRWCRSNPPCAVMNRPSNTKRTAKTI